MLAPDLPGFGDSEYDAGETYDIATQAKRLVRFLKRRNIDKVRLDLMRA